MVLWIHTSHNPPPHRHANFSVRLLLSTSTITSATISWVNTCIHSLSDLPTSTLVFSLILQEAVSTSCRPIAVLRILVRLQRALELCMRCPSKAQDYCSALLLAVRGPGVFPGLLRKSQPSSCYGVRPASLCPPAFLRNSFLPVLSLERDTLGQEGPFLTAAQTGCLLANPLAAVPSQAPSRVGRTWLLL